MTGAADRYSRVADGLTARVDAIVDPDAWDAPAPCEGWAARDVVGHLTEWVPAFFFARWDIGTTIPSAADDPAGAWHALDDALRAGFASPSVASATADTPMGEQTFEHAVDMIVTGDVLVHTWDLARAVGLDEQLDADAVHRMLDGIEAMDAPMRASGHYGPRVEVAADADEQTQLLAFTGRNP